MLRELRPELIVIAFIKRSTEETDLRGKIAQLLKCGAASMLGAQSGKYYTQIRFDSEVELHRIIRRCRLDRVDRFDNSVIVFARTGYAFDGSLIAEFLPIFG